MKGEIQPSQLDFERIAHLIEEARNRAFYKVNEELVLLYFNVGKIVSERVSLGNWGDKTVEELARFIEIKYPEMKGFNRRGLFRMKQFYETYSAPEIVSTLVTLLQSTENKENKLVSTPLTLIETLEKKSENLILKLLSQLQWSSHLHILSKTKTSEEKLFYIQKTISEKWSVRELERQLNRS